MTSPLFITFRGRQIPVRLLKRTQNRRLRLTVTAAGEIRLSAPARAAAGVIAQFLRAQEPWLIAQLARLDPAVFEQKPAETAYLFGTVLPVEIQAGLRRTAVLAGETLMLSLPAEERENPAAIDALLQRFYRQQSLAYLPARMEALLSRTPWVKTVPAVKVRRMKTQWGNCAQKGHLTFSTHLIKAPAALIDHVILHELCHLQEFNHSARFYALMQQADPNWREHKQALDALTGRLTR